MATYCFNLAAILAVSAMHSSSRVITRHQQAKIVDTQNIRKVANLYIPNLCLCRLTLLDELSDERHTDDPILMT